MLGLNWSCGRSTRHKDYWADTCPVLLKVLCKRQQRRRISLGNSFIDFSLMGRKNKTSTSFINNRASYELHQFPRLGYWFSHAWTCNCCLCLLLVLTIQPCRFGLPTAWVRQVCIPRFSHTVLLSGLYISCLAVNFFLFFFFFSWRK